MRVKCTAQLFLLSLLLGLANVARPQSPTTGQIAGVVRDPSGAVVVAAKVRLTSPAGVERETTTDAEGRYVFPLLPPAVYKVQVDASGFEAFVRDNIEVRITQYAEVDANLTLGKATQAVTVTSAPPLIQTSSETMGRVIGETPVSQLPLPTRNFQQLLSLSTGASSDLPDNTALGRGDTNINVNGQRDTSNNVVLDGTQVNIPGTNDTPSQPVPAPDSIQEFIVQTSMYDATQGRNSGGDLAIVTKSGTNALHGDVYEYLRNRVLDANDFFLNATGQPRPMLTRNQFGGTLGGPIVKDKTYFFVAYQGTRERNGASQQSLTTLNIPAGLTNDRSTATLTSFATQAYGITAINPISLALLQAQLPNGQYAIPSAAPSPVFVPANTVITPISATSRFTEDQFSVNLDHNIATSNKFSGKFFYSQDPSYQALFSFTGPAPFQAPGYGGDISFNNRVLSLTDTEMFSPNWINEAHFGFSRVNAPSTPQEPFTNAQFGIVNPLAAEFPGMATIMVTGLFTIGSNPLGDQRSTVQTWQGSDMLSYTHGKHFLRTGVDVLRYDVDFFFNSFSRGEIDFNTFQDFLNGNIAYGLLGNGVPDRAMRVFDFDWYAQEDYHVSNSLTINAGMRVGFDGGISEKRGRMVNFDPALFAKNTLPCTVVSPCNPPNGFVQLKPGQPINPNEWNVAPRFGIAWRPLGAKGLVLRTGYGIYFDRFSTRMANFQIFNYPYDIIGLGLGSFAYPFPDLAGITFPVSPAVIPSPVPFYYAGFPLAGLSTPISGLYIDPNIRMPYSQQYNFGLEWELAKSWMAEIGYVGSKGTKIINVYNFNQGALGTAPYATSGFSNNAVLNGFEQVKTNTNSLYNSLQASLTKRFSSGLQFLASYTFSKSMDDGSGAPANELGAYPGNQQDPESQRAVSDFNRPQRFVFSGVYDLPKWYKGNSHVASRFANDWELSGIATFQSGLPFSVVCEAGSTLYNRADLIPGVPISRSGSVESRLSEYFNTAAFSPTCVNAAPYGTSGRNILRGPSQQNVDFGIVKSIPVTETTKVEFRSEFFNVFNVVNFANPNNNVLVPQTVGQISSTSSGPRIIQFALKFTF